MSRSRWTRRPSRRHSHTPFNCAQALEQRVLLTGSLSNLPQKSGETFVVDDWDYEVTQSDLGFNYFSGNTGATETNTGTTSLALSTESNGSQGGSLGISFDFTGQAPQVFAGYFASLFGLTDTLISLDGSGQQPTEPTPLPGYFLDTQDLYRGFAPLADRSVELLEFDLRLESSDAITLRIELTDESGSRVFTRSPLTDNGGNWQTVSLSLPSAFNQGDTAQFNWREVSVFALLVERSNVADGIQNPDTGRFLIDNLVLKDTDGSYPDLAAIEQADGTILPSARDDFLDLVRATSFLYFRDFASTDPRTGGIIQDRSSFGDLMTVGGVGFQLNAYITGAEHGYITRQEAIERTHAILNTLMNNPQGPDRVGTIGHEGFFYHFLGIDGLRKQNFDFTATAPNEALNTVELSTIDTALAVAGVVTARQYFVGNSAMEQQIRSMADAIYGRVNWNFMLYNNPNDPQNHQFYLGWKPNETRSEEFGRFAIDDAAGEGQYSSRFDVPTGTERPQTLDFYTDEALLIALLAIGSPNPAHRVDCGVWNAIFREGEPFVKTFPGSLFTYQFLSTWLDTEALGTDNHPSRPTNFFDNTRAAIEATREYVRDNPLMRATYTDPNFWGLSAAEGPLDTYFAHAAPPAALAEHGGPSDANVEAEDGTGDGIVFQRSNASGAETVNLGDGQTRTLTLESHVNGMFEFLVRYSNDNSNILPSEQVTVSVNGQPMGSFEAEDTGDGGNGWDIFVFSPLFGPVEINAGPNQITIEVTGGDRFGVEIDAVAIVHPLETGTVTNYGVGSSIVHVPDEATAGLFASARLNLNEDAQSVPDLLHPRFGFADAFNLDIADAILPGQADAVLPQREPTGPWANFAGFAIDHGPMVSLIDNHLESQFLPQLFMSYPTIRAALDELFVGAGPVDDIIGRAASGTVSVLKSDGTAFQNKNVGVVPTGVDWDDFLTGDFNGDGLTDWAGRSPTDGHWRVILSNCSTVDPVAIWGAWSTNVSFTDLRVGDFNGDGRDDVVGRASTGTLVVGLSTGSRFTTSAFGAWSSNLGVVDVFVGDVNADGRDDLIARSSANMWVAAVSDGSSFTTSAFGAWSRNVDWLNVLVGDVNGDGRADIIGRASTGTWVVGVSDGSRFSMQRWGAWTTNTTWSDVLAGDFNGDGLTDIVGRDSNGRIIVAESDGSRFLTTARAVWSTNIAWLNVLVADFNGDGRDDVAGRASTGTWVVAVSDGDRLHNQVWGAWTTATTWDNVSAGNFV